MMIASVAVLFPGPNFAARTSAMRMPGRASPASTKRVSGPCAERRRPGDGEADHGADDQRHDRRDHADVQGVPRAEHQLGDDVATGLIGPQQEAGRTGGREPVREVQLVRRVRRPHERHQGDGDERRHQRATEVQRDGQMEQADPSGRRRRSDGVAGVSRRARKCVDLNHSWAALSRMRGSRSRRRCRPGSSGSG